MEMGTTLYILPASRGCVHQVMRASLQAPVLAYSSQANLNQEQWSMLAKDWDVGLELMCWVPCCCRVTAGPGPPPAGGGCRCGGAVCGPLQPPTL